jgi:hypothetical protein
VTGAGTHIGDRGAGENLIGADHRLVEPSVEGTKLAMVHVSEGTASDAAIGINRADHVEEGHR